MQRIMGKLRKKKEELEKERAERSMNYEGRAAFPWCQEHPGNSPTAPEAWKYAYIASKCTFKMRIFRTFLRASLFLVTCYFEDSG